VRRLADDRRRIKQLRCQINEPRESQERRDAIKRGQVEKTMGSRMQGVFSCNKLRGGKNHEEE
jgi:hypothetical protein